MTDIVERLRGKCAVVPGDNTLCDEAADEIERLQDICEDRFIKVCNLQDEIERLEHMKANLHSHIKRLEDENTKRAEVEDWKDNYNKATDACVALRAENARLRERVAELEKKCLCAREASPYPYQF